MNTSKTRILFFIGSLRSGGKERRLIELLSYLQQHGGFELMVVVTKDEIHYPAFHKLAIPYRVIERGWKRNYPALISGFYRICKEFKPHIIHTWGRMQSFYTLPAVIGQKIPLINSQITAAPPKVNKWALTSFIDRLNFRYSDVILSNSQAGIDTFNPPAGKGKVIYNGINMNRFASLPSIEQVKQKYGITTPYAVVMAASFSPNKDYDLFFRIADHLTAIRSDVTFIGVGGTVDDAKFRQLLVLAQPNPRILFPGRIDDVEALVNACDIGILFSNKTVHGEGISNSIMEYMALSKPVIANDAGGTVEILQHNRNGYLITHQSVDEIEALLVDLLNDQTKSRTFGKASREIIEATFSLDRMGKAFEQVYKDVLV